MREPEDSFVNQLKDCNERKLCFEVKISPVCFDYFCLSVKLCVKNYHFNGVIELLYTQHATIALQGHPR